MSARMSNPSSAVPQAVPVPCLSPGLDMPPPNPEGTVSFHREFLGEGVDPVPSDSRVPFPLDQVYVRDRGSAMSADVQVPPTAAGVPAQVRADGFMSAEAHPPPQVVEASPLLPLSASASLHSPFAEAQAPPPASVVSNPQSWIKL